MAELPGGFSLVAFESLDSTNEEARRRAATAADRTVYWANVQTAGRGRRGRAWMSEPGNLFLSLFLKPDCALAVASQLSFVSALALSDLLGDFLPQDRITLKWPNDVLVDGAKICGILLEASSTGGAGPEGIVIGIGLNVASHPEGTPYPATDLETVAGRTFVVRDVLDALVGAFSCRYDAWLEKGFATVRTDWLAHARNIGGPVEVRLDRETLRGKFVDLDPSGALVLETADGGKRLIAAGDVYFPDAARGIE